MRFIPRRTHKRRSDRQTPDRRFTITAVYAVSVVNVSELPKFSPTVTQAQLASRPANRIQGLRGGNFLAKCDAPSAGVRISADLEADSASLFHSLGCRDNLQIGWSWARTQRQIPSDWLPCLPRHQRTPVVDEDRPCNSFETAVRAEIKSRETSLFKARRIVNISLTLSTYKATLKPSFFPRTSTLGGFGVSIKCAAM